MRVSGLGIWMQGLEFGVWGLGFRANRQALAFREVPQRQLHRRKVLGHAYLGNGGVGCRELGSGFRSVGFRAQGSGFRVWGLGFRVQGSGFRVGVQRSSCRVQGSGFRVQGLTGSRA